MKKFSINCDFGGQAAPFDFYIGQPEKEHHPLHFQADWLAKQRNGVVPAEVMTAIGKLKDIAEKNNVSLEDLCVYAIGSWDKGQEQQTESTEFTTEGETDSNNSNYELEEDKGYEEETQIDTAAIETTEEALASEISPETTQTFQEEKAKKPKTKGKATKAKKKKVK